MRLVIWDAIVLIVTSLQQYDFSSGSEINSTYMDTIPCYQTTTHKNKTQIMYNSYTIISLKQYVLHWFLSSVFHLILNSGFPTKSPVETSSVQQKPPGRHQIVWPNERMIIAQGLGWLRKKRHFSGILSEIVFSTAKKICHFLFLSICKY